MKCRSIGRVFHSLVWLLCLGLVACGGGGGSGGDDLVTAHSASFSPTTGKSSDGRDVALRWVYTMNDGRPVTASALGVSMSIAIPQVEVTLDPANLQRRVAIQGSVSGNASGQGFSGTFSGAAGEDLAFGAGKTLFKNQSLDITLTLSANGQSATGHLVANTSAFDPACEWFLDNEALDQLPVGQVVTITSSAISDIRVDITDEPSIVKSNQITQVNERWTILAKLPTMVVRGHSYQNVVEVSRQTAVPDFSGNSTAVTMTYWVAKGVGMIKGQGIYPIIGASDVTYELTQTNLSQS